MLMYLTIMIDSNYEVLSQIPQDHIKTGLVLSTLLIYTL